MVLVEEVDAVVVDGKVVVEVVVVVGLVVVVVVLGSGGAYGVSGCNGGIG